MLDLLYEQTRISPSSNSCKQGTRLLLWEGFEHVEERLEIFVLALLHGGFRFGILAWAFSSDALMTLWTASVALSFWLDASTLGNPAGFWHWVTFVLRLRQAAQANETRCLLGGNEVVSPRGAVDGKRGRRSGRGMLFRLADGDSIVTLRMALKKCSEDKNQEVGYQAQVASVFSLLKNDTALFPSRSRTCKSAGLLIPKVSQGPMASGRCTATGLGPLVDSRYGNWAQVAKSSKHNIWHIAL
jgi:hypothetical protein